MENLACEEKLNKLMIQMTKIEEHTKQNKKTINEIYRRLFGNGQEGIITTLIKHKVYFALMGIGLGLLSTCIIKMILG